jgi:hypothetical protein
MSNVALTRDGLIDLLSRTDDLGNRARERALLVLVQNQTADEQRDEATKYHNGTGFLPMHARKMTSFALQVQRSRRPKGERLSEKQHLWLLRKDRGGTPRIGKYTRQLIEAAKERQP